MIKKLIFSLVMVAMVAISSNAQRIAVVDINALLADMPEYKSAQGELDKISAEWRQEIAQEYDKIKSMYNKYQAEQVLLSDEVRKQREDEIVAKEEEVRGLQKRRFGADGDLFRKRQELVSPVQDKIFSNIESFASEKGYDIIFDKSSSAGILFTSDEFDKTNDIRKRL